MGFVSQWNSKTFHFRTSRSAVTPESGLIHFQVNFTAPGTAFGLREHIFMLYNYLKILIRCFFRESIYSGIIVFGYAGGLAYALVIAQYVCCLPARPLTIFFLSEFLIPSTGKSISPLGSSIFSQLLV